MNAILIEIRNGDVEVETFDGTPAIVVNFDEVGQDYEADIELVNRILQHGRDTGNYVSDFVDLATRVLEQWA